MDLTHTFTVPTAVDDAWALFMDLESVGNCFPGATVTEVADDSFSGTVKVKLGPIALLYAGSGKFVERDDVAHRAVIEAKGKDKRGNGTAGATVVLELTPDGAGTRADVVTDLSVTGKPAQFGRGVMQDVSDKLLQAFIDCVEKQLTAAPTEPDSAPTEADPAPGGTAAAAVSGAVSGGGQPPPGDTSETHTAGTSAGSSTRAGAERMAGTSAGTSAETSAETSAGTTASASAETTAPAGTGAGPVASGRTAGAAASGRTATAGGASHARPRLVRPDGDDALDLGSAVGPVLMKRYGAIVVAGLIGLVIGCLLGRRASHNP